MPVWIVKAGGYGGLQARDGDYDDFIEMIQELLEDKKPEVVEDAGEAFRQASSKEDSVLVLITKGMWRWAQNAAEENPAIRVVLFSMDLPDAKSSGVVLLDKEILFNDDRKEEARQAILGR